MTSALLRRGAGGLLALAAAVSEALARGWLGTAGVARRQQAVDGLNGEPFAQTA